MNWACPVNGRPMTLNGDANAIAIIPEWVGLGWSGLAWASQTGVGLEWIELEWVGLRWTKQAGLDWSGLA